MIWFALVVVAVLVVWAKYRFDRRVYLWLWYAAISAAFIAGLVL